MWSYKNINFLTRNISYLQEVVKKKRPDLHHQESRRGQEHHWLGKRHCEVSPEEERGSGRSEQYQEEGEEAQARNSWYLGRGGRMWPRTKWPSSKQTRPGRSSRRGEQNWGPKVDNPLGIDGHEIGESPTNPVVRGDHSILEQRRGPDTPKGDGGHQSQESRT